MWHRRPKAWTARSGPDLESRDAAVIRLGLGGLAAALALTGALVLLGGSGARTAHWPVASTPPLGSGVAATPLPEEATVLEGAGSLPAAAQSAISATLGAESPAFFARRSLGGYRLGGGGVTAQLGTRGVALRGGGVSLAMTVAGVGRGGRLERRGRVVGRRAREPRLARPGRADGVVRGGPARDRAGLHALPPPGRERRAGHARAAARRRTSARHRDSIGNGVPDPAGPAGAELRSAVGDRRERARASRSARAASTAGC